MQVWTEPFEHEIIDELKLEAAKCFRRFQLPTEAEEWWSKRRELCEKLSKKLKLQIDHELDLDCHWLGEIHFEDYTIRQLCYRSVPDRYVTASLYVPNGGGPFPGIMNLHGHVRSGRLTEKIQRTASVLARSGYVVLSVDAFGAGERTAKHGAFEYHGALRGGGLLNIGESLMGIQIIDNARGVDLLQSLPYVDGERIGAIGSSGGGNQSMYLAAFDERVKAVAPVVSVGSYQSYVGGTNCICELLPDGLTVCEESALLAMIAPRALKICNAMHDINPTFYVAEMLRSYTEAGKVYAALGVPENISTMAFNGPHSLPVEVISAALGFFDYHLKNEGSCLPRVLPEVTLLPETELMMFQSGARLPEVCSIAEYIAGRAAKLKKHAAGTPRELAQVLRLENETIRHIDYLSSEDGYEKYTLETSRGRMLPVLFKRGSTGICRICAAPGGKAELNLDDTADSVIIFDPWGCGECGYIPERFAYFSEQHQLARSLIWLGRRLMGEWCMDYLTVREFARRETPSAQIELTGYRDSGLAALYSTIINPTDVAAVHMVNPPRSLAEVMPELPPGIEYSPTLENMPTPHTMALCIPGILIWGDIDYAVSIAPCPVTSSQLPSA